MEIKRAYKNEINFIQIAYDSKTKHKVRFMIGTAEQ